MQLVKNELRDLIRYGNLKLPKTTAIFNMCPGTDCPSELLGLCTIGCKCYAQRAERFRPNVLPFRKRQKRYWKKTSAERFVKDFKLATSRKRTRIRNLRLNEAGDFDAQEDVDKAEKIAKDLAAVRIQVYCYTARSDLDYTKCEHLTVNTSGFIKQTAVGTTNIFFAVTEYSDMHPRCPGDCRKCNICAKKHGKTTEIKFH